MDILEKTAEAEYENRSEYGSHSNKSQAYPFSYWLIEMVFEQPVAGSTDVNKYRKYRKKIVGDKKHMIGRRVKPGDTKIEIGIKIQNVSGVKNSAEMIAEKEGYIQPGHGLGTIEYRYSLASP